MKIDGLFYICSILVCLVFTSCVRDTDLDQANDIVLTPIVELDLIYFNLNASQFYDTITNTSRLTVSDTTEIRFLDDVEVRENLKQADFFFQFTNGISREFEVDFLFLSEQNDTTYVTQTTVDAGNVEVPVFTIFEHSIGESEIEQLTLANKVVVNVHIPSSSETLQGNLNLQSKTTYYLDISN